MTTQRLSKRIGSDEARRWVRSLRLGNPFAKAILMAVANYVDENGCGYPGIDTLHDDTEIAHNTIVSRLKWCDEIGAIIFSKCWVDEHGVRNRNGRGRITSSEIQFLMEADIEAVAAAAAASAAPRANRGWAAKKTGNDDQFGSAPHAEQNESISPSLAPQQPCTPCGRIAEKEEITSPNPPLKKGGALEKNEEAEKRFEQFAGSGYPDGILDLDAAHREFLKLSENDQLDAIRGVPVYADRLRKRREKSKAGHLYLRKRLWRNLMAGSISASAAPTIHAPDSSAGRALATLGKVIRYKPVYCGDGSISHLGEITPRLLALATAPPESQWFDYEHRTPNFAAWRDFARDVFPRWGFSLPRIRTPWPFPPRVDGSIGPPAQSTDPPRPFITEEDEEYLRENQGL